MIEWRRLRLNFPLIMGGLILFLLLLTLILPLVLPLSDPDQIQLVFEVDGQLRKPPLAPGEGGFVLGTDRAGRDLFSRLVYGARLTLLIGVAALTVRMLLGVPAGLIAGWKGGRIGRLTTALSLSMSALPALVLIALLLSFLPRWAPGSSWLWVYVSALSLVGLPRLMEQVRALTVQAKTLPHVEAAVSLGAGPWRILTRHIFPMIRGDLIVAMAGEMAWVLIIMGQLAIFDHFVGGRVTVSLEEGRPSLSLERASEWSSMIGVNRDILRNQWWIPIYPGIALGTVVAGFQLMAEGIRIRMIRRG